MGTLRGDDRRTLEEAATWFTRLKQDSVSEGVIDDFLRWRRDPAHDAAYAEVEARWRQADRVSNDPELVRLTEAALRRPKAWDLLKRRLARNLLPLGLVAATLAVVLILLATLLQPQAYETKVGAQQIVRLEDGSILRLNTASRVEVRFDRRERRLVLKRGQAFFEVAHDAARPFIVAAGDTRVRALGTKFDVRRMEGEVQVTLAEGRVEVARPKRGQAWTLAPNQSITLNGAPPAPRPADAAQATSWTTGRLRFRDTPLAEAVAEVNRYTTTKITLDAGPIANERVSGVFDTGDTKAFVSAVTELFSLTARTTPDGIHLRAREPAAAS
jgi:transmembrane sensor